MASGPAAFSASTCLPFLRFHPFQVRSLQLGVAIPRFWTLCHYSLEVSVSQLSLTQGRSGTYTVYSTSTPLFEPHPSK
jgi:hypothetical protein